MSYDKQWLHWHEGSSSTGASGQGTGDAGSIMLKIKLVELDGSKTANPLQSIPDLSSQSHPGDHCVGCAQLGSVNVSLSDKFSKVRPGEKHVHAIAHDVEGKAGREVTRYLSVPVQVSR